MAMSIGAAQNWTFTPSLAENDVAANTVAPEDMTTYNKATGIADDGVGVLIDGKFAAWKAKDEEADKADLVDRAYGQIVHERRLRPFPKRDDEPPVPMLDDPVLRRHPEGLIFGHFPHDITVLPRQPAAAPLFGMLSCLPCYNPDIHFDIATGPNHDIVGSGVCEGQTVHVTFKDTSLPRLSGEFKFERPLCGGNSYMGLVWNDTDGGESALHYSPAQPCCRFCVCCSCCCDLEEGTKLRSGWFLDSAESRRSLRKPLYYAGQTNTIDAVKGCCSATASSGCCQCCCAPCRACRGCCQMCSRGCCKTQHTYTGLHSEDKTPLSYAELEAAAMKTHGRCFRSGDGPESHTVNAVADVRALVRMTYGTCTCVKLEIVDGHEVTPGAKPEDRTAVTFKFRGSSTPHGATATDQRAVLAAAVSHAVSATRLFAKTKLITGFTIGLDNAYPGSVARRDGAGGKLNVPLGIDVQAMTGAPEEHVGMGKTIGSAVDKVTDGVMGIMSPK